MCAAVRVVCVCEIAFVFSQGTLYRCNNTPCSALVVRNRDTLGAKVLYESAQTRTKLFTFLQLIACDLKVSAEVRGPFFLRAYKRVWSCTLKLEGCANSKRLLLWVTV